MKTGLSYFYRLPALQQPAPQLAACGGGIPVVEKVSGDAQPFGGGDIRRAVVDEEGFGGIESVAFQQDFVNPRSGFTVPSSQETTSPSKSP